MKIRPHVTVRFRDEDQDRDIRAKAERSGISMNEYILRKIEAMNWPQPSGVVTVTRPESRAGDTVPTRLPEVVDSDGHDTKTCRVYKCGVCAALELESRFK